MKFNRPVLILVGVLIALVIVVGVTLTFVPQETHPAYDVAVRFVNAASSGDDAAAEPLMGVALIEYARAQCPDGRISQCISALIPPEWGAFRQFVYRRAQPDGAAWEVDLIGYYETGVGASGVCVYARVEPTTAIDEVADSEQVGAVWQVTEYAGWVHCGDPASRNMAANPGAPNRTP